ncbi:MAG: hypothetical protein AMXMBFR47_19230 [Planctomycetota bacterium]
MFEHAPYPCSLWVPIGRITYANAVLRAIAGDDLNRTCGAITGCKRLKADCGARRAMLGGDPVRSPCCLDSLRGATTLHVPMRAVGITAVLQLWMPHADFRGSEFTTQRPIVKLCAWCRSGHLRLAWERIEHLLLRSGVDLSHGICADCRRKLEIRRAGFPQPEPSGEIGRPGRRLVMRPRPACDTMRNSNRRTEFRRPGVRDDGIAPVQQHVPPARGVRAAQGA